MRQLTPSNIILCGSLHFEKELKIGDEVRITEHRYGLNNAPTKVVALYPNGDVKVAVQ